MQALCSATRCHANVLGCMFLTIDLAKINIAPQPFVSKTSISTNEILHVNICKSTKAWSESHAIMPTLVLLTRLVAPIFEDNCGLLQWHTWLSKAILAQLLLHEDMPPPHTNKKDEKKHYIQAKCCIFPPFRKKKLQNLKKQHHPNSKLILIIFAKLLGGLCPIPWPPKGCRFRWPPPRCVDQ